MIAMSIIVSDMVSLPIVVKWLSIRHIISALPAKPVLVIPQGKIDSAPPTLQAL